MTNLLPDDPPYRRGFIAGRNETNREVAEWMINHSYATGHGDSIKDLLGELSWQIDKTEPAPPFRDQILRLQKDVEALTKALSTARAEENERCAKIAESYRGYPTGASERIRASLAGKEG